MAIIAAQRLHYYHPLERERIHLLLVSDAMTGVADVAAGRVKNAQAMLAGLQRRRAAKTSG